MRRVIVISSIEPTAVKTGRIEEVVGAVLAAHELDLNNTVIIEHCPENPLFEETFDILKFEPEQGGQKLCNPQWKQQSRANVESLIGTEFDAQSHPTR